MLKTFLDTNILVYSVDANDKSKQNTARLALKSLKEKGRPVISTQVLQEFYNAATKKLEYDPATAKIMMHDFAKMEGRVGEVSPTYLSVVAFVSPR